MVLNTIKWYHLFKSIFWCYLRRDVGKCKNMGNQWFPQAKNFFGNARADTNNHCHCLHCTNTLFRIQVCSSRLRIAGQTSATPKKMSGSDVEAKQTGRSAAWHKGARDFAQEFKPTKHSNMLFKNVTILWCLTPSSDLWVVASVVSTNIVPCCLLPQRCKRWIWTLLVGTQPNGNMDTARDAHILDPRVTPLRDSLQPLSCFNHHIAPPFFTWHSRQASAMGQNLAAREAVQELR